MTLLVMSRKELGRLEILIDLCEGRLTASAAGSLMEISRRQTLGLLKIFRSRGPEGLVSRKRGQPSNRHYPGAFRSQVLGLVRERYHDFGPTLAAEKRKHPVRHAALVR